VPRIFFATDLHGSETCWRKFLNAARYYNADVLICGGDMTGKAIVPLVEENGTFEYTLSGERETVSRDQVDEVEGLVRRKGYYPVRVTPDELHRLGADEAERHHLFQRVMLDGVQRWMDLAQEKLQGTGVRCFVCPGNDDELEVDGVIARSETVELGEGRVIDVGGYEMISTGWSNPTPWNTHREEEEDVLGKRIEAMASQVRDPSRAIFNLHPPPYRSGLDEAPALDKDMRLKHGGRALRAVGSTAVRAAIERYGPLLSLHGHVHEGKGVAKLGRTLSINPGSSYEEGLLMGAVVMLDTKKGVKSYQLVAG
jgi:Icc-related predicted phosphoesterase